MNHEVLRYTAFSTDPQGGNPAGIVLDARGMLEAEMQAVATEVGYSETAFLMPRDDGAFDVRYYSPLAEVSFCGHATIAAMVAHAQRHGPGMRRLHTRAGEVRVDVDDAGVATLVSVAPRVVPLEEVDLEALLVALRWKAGDLDDTLTPAIAYAGAWHPIIPVRERERLARLDYDFDALAALMAQRGWTTVNLVWRESADVLHARNPFPPGGVIEDPATGAAAAALGAWLAHRNALSPQRRFVVRQGDDLGRPSRLDVTVPDDLSEGIRVSGTATRIG